MTAGFPTHVKLIRSERSWFFHPTPHKKRKKIMRIIAVHHDILHYKNSCVRGTAIQRCKENKEKIRTTIAALA